MKIPGFIYRLAPFGPKQRGWIAEFHPWLCVMIYRNVFVCGSLSWRLSHLGQHVRPFVKRTRAMRPKCRPSFSTRRTKNCHEQTLTLPTFTIHLRQMKVNIPYIECLAWFTFQQKHPYHFLIPLLNKKHMETIQTFKWILRESFRGNPWFQFFFSIRKTPPISPERFVGKWPTNPPIELQVSRASRPLGQFLRCWMHWKNIGALVGWTFEWWKTCISWEFSMKFSKN